LVQFAAASAQQSTTFRDASGRITGTVTTDSNGTRTFRGGSGRTTGTATTDSNGTTTFRDTGVGPLAQLRRHGDEPVQTGSVAGDDTGDTGPLARLGFTRSNTTASSLCDVTFAVAGGSSVAPGSGGL
jgi:hypothetical protein